MVRDAIKDYALDIAAGTLLLAETIYWPNSQVPGMNHLHIPICKHMANV